MNVVENVILRGTKMFQKKINSREKKLTFNGFLWPFFDSERQIETRNAGQRERGEMTRVVARS